LVLFAEHLSSVDGKQQFASLLTFPFRFLAWFRHNQTGLWNPSEIASAPEKRAAVSRPSASQAGATLAMIFHFIWPEAQKKNDCLKAL